MSTILQDRKCRFWDKQQKKMLYIPIVNGFKLMGMGRKLLPLQFITRQDSKLVDIYEGDIVEYLPAKEEYDGALFINIVEWDQCTTRFRLSRHSAPAYSWSQATVIGNIFENPELVQNKVKS